MSADSRPNHFHTDSLGDPATCTDDHVHPERSPLIETKALLARLDDARSVTNSTLSDKLVAGVTATALVAIVERLDALALAIESAPAASVDEYDLVDLLDDEDDDDDDDDDDDTPPRNPLLDKIDQHSDVAPKAKKGKVAK